MLLFPGKLCIIEAPATQHKSRYKLAHTEHHLQISGIDIRFRKFPEFRVYGILIHNHSRIFVYSKQLRTLFEFGQKKTFNLNE